MSCTSRMSCLRLSSDPRSGACSGNMECTQGATCGGTQGCSTVVRSKTFLQRCRYQVPRATQTGHPLRAGRMTVCPPAARRPHTGLVGGRMPELQERGFSWPPVPGQSVERGFDDMFWLPATVLAVEVQGLHESSFSLAYTDGTEEEGVLLGELRDANNAAAVAAVEKRAEARRGASTALSSLCALFHRRLFGAFNFWCKLSAQMSVLDPGSRLRQASITRAAARQAKVDSILAPLLSSRDSLVEVVSRLETSVSTGTKQLREAGETLDSSTRELHSAREEMHSVVVNLMASTGVEKPARGPAHTVTSGIEVVAMALNESVPPISFVDGAITAGLTQSLRSELEQLWACSSSGCIDEQSAGSSTNSGASNVNTVHSILLPDPADILLVQSQCNVTMAKAVETLEAHGNDLVAAVVALSPSFDRGKVDGSVDENSGRSDYVIWLSGTEAHAPTALTDVLKCIDSIVLDQLAPLISGVLRGATLVKPVKAMLSCYPGKGSHYRRHCDNVDGSNGRRVAAILYLNEGWQPWHGGCLRASATMDADAQFVDVEPVMGRLVLFLCDERVPHEVLPSHSTRYAVTVWYEEDIMSRLSAAAALS